MKVNQLIESWGNQTIHSKVDQPYVIYFDYTGAGRGPEPIAGPFPSREAAEQYAAEEGYDLKNKDYFVDVYNEANEAWAEEAKVKHTGRNTNKSVAQLKKERTSAKKRGDTKAIKQKDFAIRAKSGWGKA